VTLGLLILYSTHALLVNLSFWQWNQESPVSAITAVLPETFSVCVEREYNLTYIWEDAPSVVFICSCIPVKPFGKCRKRKSSIGTDPKAGPWATTTRSGCTMIAFYVWRRSEYPTELWSLKIGTTNMYASADSTISEQKAVLTCSSLQQHKHIHLVTFHVHQLHTLHWAHCNN